MRKHNAILLTVEHTGTQYFMEGLRKSYNRATYSHLNLGWKRKTAKNDVYTTYRDPIVVAASWINRKKLTKAGIKRWQEQWRQYQLLKDINPRVLDLCKGKHQYGIEFGDSKVNSYQDTYGLYTQLKQGNKQAILDKIDENLIKLAYECSEWARKQRS